MVFVFISGEVSGSRIWDETQFLHEVWMATPTSLETGAVLLIKRLTVAIETPAFFATSLILLKAYLS
jgi:hypothetical protein